MSKVGITHHAQDQLGDIVFCELPKVGMTYSFRDSSVDIESVKTAANVYHPALGEIVQVNEKVAEDASLVNSDAEGDGWLYSFKVQDSSELEKLMDKDSYDKFVEESH